MTKTIEEDAQELITALQSIRTRFGDEGFLALAMVCSELSTVVQDWLDKRPPAKTESLERFAPPARLGRPRIIRLAGEYLKNKGDKRGG